MANVTSVIEKIKGKGTGGEVLGKVIKNIHPHAGTKAGIPDSEKQLGAK